jgi:hypothetical protein
MADLTDAEMRLAITYMFQHSVAANGVTNGNDNGAASAH